MALANKWFGCDLLYENISINHGNQWCLKLATEKGKGQTEKITEGNK